MMGRVKERVVQASENFGKFFVVEAMLILCIGVVLIMIRRGDLLWTVVNLGVCLLAFVMNCIMVWRKNGRRIAFFWSLVYSVFIVIMYWLFMRELWFVAFFAVPCLYLLITAIDYKRINSRKNIVIVILAMLLIVILIVMGIMVKNAGTSLLPVIFALITMGMCLLLKPLAGFNGLHFDFRKYHKPQGKIKRVSAVIPNYNYARYLKERVNSIVEQNYPIYELIILDDKSTDDSEETIREIIAELKVRKPELAVRFIPNDVNSGNVFKQWAKAFEVSTGDYVWICEADDSCSKYYLSAVMRAFEDDDVVMSYSESRTIDGEGRRLKRDLRDWVDMFNTGHWRHSYVLNGKDELNQVLCINNTIANVSGVVFRKKKIFGEYLKRAQEYTLAGDWYFYSKVLLDGKIAYHDESLNYHRMHDKGVTLTTDNHAHYWEILSVQDEIAKNVKLSSEAKRKTALRRKELEESFGISEDEKEYQRVSINELVKKHNVNDEILLSVIVCVYNGEDYIGGCLKSVLNGLPDKTEVIVIDDGSKDGTADIVKRLGKNDERIRYFHKENGGLSSAKNYGLKKANGRYVIFMDADDRIAFGGYDVMLKKAIEQDADMVVCDMELVYDSGEVVYRSVYDKEYDDELIGFLANELMASSNNKMTKRELFSGVRYPEGQNNEDVAVTPLLLAKSKKIQYIPSGLYKYYQRSGSIQNSGFSEKRLVIFDTCEQAINTIKKEVPEKYETIKGIIVSYQLILILVYVICDIKDKKERYKMIASFCKRYCKLDANKNSFIEDYCKSIGMSKLNSYLLNGQQEKIDRYVRKCKNKNVVKGYIKKIEKIIAGR